MPSSKSYYNIEKHCIICNSVLILKNKRDIERKRFCSASCRNSYGTKKRIQNLPEKICVGCGNIYKSKALRQKFCSSSCMNVAQVERSYKYLNGNWDGYILHLIKKKGRKHLTLEQIKSLFDAQKGMCAITKVPLTCIKIPNHKKIHTNLSIDRIDSSRDYNIDNLQLVCAIVNVMKSSLTMEEFKWWTKMVQEGLQNS